MPKPRERRIKSFSEYVRLVERLKASTPGPLWYRGCGKSKYELLPSLYRHPRRRNLAELATLEKELQIHFRIRSIPFNPTVVNDDWDRLFFMQHYRVPTRLLDWTENPFIGLFFAIMSAPKTLRKGGLAFQGDAVVWVLDPISWNRHTLSFQGFTGGILMQGDEALRGYNPSLAIADMNPAPVALWGAHNSPRIVAQRGVFTVFGKSTNPIETTFENDSYPIGCLEKIILQQEHLLNLRNAILNSGITESVVFPDLEGLAYEIRRTFGFEE